jgi:hypothetical protein
MSSHSIDPEDKRVGNRHWPRDSYKLINGALTRLMGRLQKWNSVAASHGAATPPYDEELHVIQSMVEWGNRTLENKALHEVTVNGITVESLRYMKAALILDAWQIDKGIVASTGSAQWPGAVAAAVNERALRCRALAEAIPYSPADILDQFRDEHGAPAPSNPTTPAWDVFVSHASEDKGTFVDDLVRALEAAQIQVWYDSNQLALGDSLRRSIDRGLARSRYGVVVLSPTFFAKEWPRRELDGLAALEVDDRKVILPVWHQIGLSEVRRYSPMLADRVGVASSLGIAAVVGHILQVVRAR